MRNITNIYLGYNRIHKIDGYAFAGTEDIQMLLLNNNPIKVVNSTAFSGLKKVEFLFLPAGVRTLQADAFSGLEQVGVLKLAYLDLTEMSAHTFRGLSRIRVLSIENSDLATIRRGAFHGMERIGELKIANNKIDRIENLSISEEVRKLTLKGNHILEIPSPDALGDIRVRQIKVELNHFPCNCRVLFLVESRVGNDTDFLRDNKCISPFSLNGRPMVDMDSMGWVGVHNQNKMRVFVRCAILSRFLPAYLLRLGCSASAEGRTWRRRSRRRGGNRSGRGGRRSRRSRRRKTGGGGPGRGQSSRDMILMLLLLTTFLRINCH